MTRGKERKCMCLCKKEKDSQGFNQNGLGPHGFGGYHRKIRISSSSRSVTLFRVLENALVWTPRENRNSDWDGVWSCLWCVWNKGHGSHEPCVWRHRSWMSVKLNISVFVPSSVGDFEKASQTRLICVFVALLRYVHTLTCIIRGLHLHVHLHLYVKRVVLLSSMHCATMPKISQKILCRTLIWKMYGLVFTTRVLTVFLWSYRHT